MDPPVNQASDPQVYGPEPQAWFQRLAGILLPPRCLLCGDPGHAGLDLCAACLASLPVQGPACTRCALPLPAEGVCGQCLRKPPPLDGVHASFRYSVPVDRLLPRLKFHNDLAAGRLLAQLMAARAPRLEQGWVLVPVPLHPRRLRQRGYDQALELARPVARRLGLALHPRLLRRRRSTEAQSGLDAAARRRNLRDAFAIADGQPPPRVLLLDDVMTTGATLYAAARALRRAGAAEVRAWVCARTP